jgi:hypothetical protein
MSPGSHDLSQAGSHYRSHAGSHYRPHAGSHDRLTGRAGAARRFRA